MKQLAVRSSTAVVKFECCCLCTVDDFETESEFGDDRVSLRSFQSAVSLLLD